jgi:hypothetical protein
MKIKQVKLKKAGLIPLSGEKISRYEPSMLVKHKHGWKSHMRVPSDLNPKLFTDETVFKKRF